MRFGLMGWIPAYAGMTGEEIADCRLLIEDWRMRVGLTGWIPAYAGMTGEGAGMTGWGRE